MKSNCRLLYYCLKPSASYKMFKNRSNWQSYNYTMFFHAVNCKEKINNNYFQIFSKKSNIFRIYFFNLDKKNKAVIEIINNKNLNLDVEFGNAKSLIKNWI